MAVELVTGFAGEPHIDSEDVGAFNAATMGSGSYILTGCTMSMTTVNKLHIAAGELLIQGRHVRITGTGIDLAVANGTSGYNRIDLAVLHYSKASSGVESVAFEVVKGTPTTGTATAPTHSGGSILNGDSNVYVTLGQVAVTGLTVGTPEAALATLPSLAALGDSVSLEELTISTHIWAWKVGKLVVLGVSDLAVTLSDYYAEAKITTMPEGWRPRADTLGSLSTNDTPINVYLHVKESGSVYVKTTSGGSVLEGKPVRGQVVYAIA